VKNVMARPVITIDKNGSVHEVAKIMTEKGIGCIVVTDKDAPVGMATERDILRSP
jgi:CBS domain-containing protein